MIPCLVLFYFFERQRDRQADLPSTGNYPVTQHLGLGWGKTGKQDLSLGLPVSDSSAHLLPSMVCVSWMLDWKQSQDSNLGTLIRNMGLPSTILTTGPNTESCVGFVKIPCECLEYCVRHG